MVNTAENTSMVNVMFALFMVMFVITAMDIQKYHQGRHGAHRRVSTAALAAPASRVARELRVWPDAPPPETNSRVENRSGADGKPADGSRTTAVAEAGLAVSAESAIRTEAAIQNHAGRKTDAGIEMAAVETVDPGTASSAASSLWESAAALDGDDMTDIEPAAAGTGIDIQPLSVDEHALIHP